MTLKNLEAHLNYAVHPKPARPNVKHCLDAYCAIYVLHAFLQRRKGLTNSRLGFQESQKRPQDTWPGYAQNHYRLDTQFLLAILVCVP